MSNTEASRVYELIVESVVNEVREDFENAGIDEQTLQDLKRVWQTKLSETQVTKFSWDPQGNSGQLPIDNVTSSDFSEQNSNNGNSAGVAKSNAVPSEYSLNDSQGLVLPGFSNDDPNKMKTSEKSSNDQDQRGQEHGDDVDHSPQDAQEEDGAHVKNEADQAQGLKEEQDNDTKLENSQEIELTISYGDGERADMLKQEAKKAKRSALLDTDEVGSELDDSDDDYLISEGEEDGPDENLMLCLYDKVTRTKARWKCSLKDGIVTINRKDFTFQKSQVEAEWV